MRARADVYLVKPLDFVGLLQDNREVLNRPLTDPLLRLLAMEK